MTDESASTARRKARVQQLALIGTIAGSLISYAGLNHTSPILSISGFVLVLLAMGITVWQP